MAIAPISSVSFRNNYNQVNFEGKKKEHKSSGMHIPSAVKAIPLATAIAMSPLTSVDASAQDLLNGDAIVGEAHVENSWYSPWGMRDCYLYGVDTDGNSATSEQLFLQRYFSPASGDPERKTIKDVDGINRTYGISGKEGLRVDTLEVKHEYESYPGLGLGLWGDNYYAIGPGFSTTYGFTTEHGTKVGKEYKTKPRMRQRISKELYDFIKECMGDRIEYKGIDKNKE